jgi:hypothetical protein
VEGFGNSLGALQLPGDPLITVTVNLGGQTFSNTENWTSVVQNGVVVKLMNEFEGQSSC